MPLSLGEGDTPLLPLPRVARDVGVKDLFVKNEAANPTGSHKDRLAATAVSAGLQIGAEVITGASTGNHGAALAAYSAQAGLRCVIFTTSTIPDGMRAAIEVTGAELVVGADADARYGLMADAVERDRLSGLYAEVSSSIAIAAARRLVRDGTIAPGASVVCVLTATGLKDPATTLRSLPAARAS